MREARAAGLQAELLSGEKTVNVLIIVTVLAYTPPHPTECLNAIAGLEGIEAPAKTAPRKISYG